MDGKELGNQAAHPWIRHGSERGVEWKESEPGMTLRQHFAGLAMQAMELKSDWNRSSDDLRPGCGADKEAAHMAKAAVRYADALLAELAKET